MEWLPPALIAIYARFLAAANTDRMADGGGGFRIAYERGRAQLKTGLRRKQIQVAMTGSVAMLIWLGKQQLGQQEKVIETRRGMDELFDDELPVHNFETAEEAREYLRRMGVKG